MRRTQKQSLEPGAKHRTVSNPSLSLVWPMGREVEQVGKVLRGLIEQKKKKNESTFFLCFFFFPISKSHIQAHKHLKRLIRFRKTLKTLSSLPILVSYGPRRVVQAADKTL